jgi:hypothetical protein
MHDLRHHGDDDLARSRRPRRERPHPDHLRVAVREPGTSRSFAAALAGILVGDPVAEEIR